MKAMILAAGRGERMKPLTDVCPKPLLKVQGIPLIEYHIRKLANIGIQDVVINIAWLGEQIVEYLQTGEKYGVNIQYSWEQEGALETAGGIMKALPLLQENNDPFLVINGDIFINYDFRDLPQLSETCLAHLWLTENPEHNPSGDFYLDNELVKNLPQNESASRFLKSDDAKKSLTFSGIGLYRPSIFTPYQNNIVMPLAPILKNEIENNHISGSFLPGLWTDVGTPERLSQLNKSLQG